jgi:hypothetical protein
MLLESSRSEWLKARRSRIIVVTVRRERRWTTAGATPGPVTGPRRSRNRTRLFLGKRKAQYSRGFPCDQPGGTGVPLQKTLTTEVYSSEPAAYFEAMIGDHGAAILDAVRCATGLLQQQPANLRRIILLLSQSQDDGMVLST